jgi:uncharacterized protein (DUF2141 family)
MGNTQVAREWLTIDSIGQHRHFTQAFMTANLTSTVEDSKPGRIVATIFQPPQAFYQNSSDFTTRRCTNDSAHVLFLVFIDFFWPFPAINIALFTTRYG